MSLSEDILKVAETCDVSGHFCELPLAFGYDCGDYKTCGTCVAYALRDISNKVRCLENQNKSEFSLPEDNSEDTKGQVQDRIESIRYELSCKRELSRIIDQALWPDGQVPTCENTNNQIASELDKRLLPPGYGWPCFDHNRRIDFGEKVKLDDSIGEIQTVEFHRNGYFTIVALDDNGNILRKTYSNDSHLERPKLDPIGSDGLPVHEGDHGYWISRPDIEVIVRHVYQNEFPNLAVYDVNGCLNLISIDEFTHTKPEQPDSWDRLERDAKKLRYTIAMQLGDYHFNDSSNDTVQTRLIDLIHRARNLAEKENNHEC